MGKIKLFLRFGAGNTVYIFTVYARNFMDFMRGLCVKKHFWADCKLVNQVLSRVSPAINTLADLFTA